MTTTQGVKENPYILYSSSYLWPSGTTELTYSFNDYIFSSSDAARQAKFHLTLSENYRNLVREAMDAWERVSGVRFREVADDPDNDIRIGWSAESDGLYGTLGVATTWTSTGSFGRTLKVALHFDLADRHDLTQFYDTALHEIGHAIGIDHSNVTGVVMSGTPNSPYHDQPGRDVLKPDDIAAAQALWGVTPSGPSRTLTGTVYADTLAGGDGNDTIKGNFGNDVITGGDGDDLLAGNGVYWTHWNNPQDNYWSRTYDGSTDRDTIYGGEGNDSINGNAGVDYLVGGPGNDTVFGGQNEGTWQPGETRTNTIHLRSGIDQLWGGEGDDFLNGNMGTDVLHGGPGDDYLRGGQDLDALFGGDGSDTLYGDLEGDGLYGGDGNDVIVCGNAMGAGDGFIDLVGLVRTDSGQDTIHGFEAHDQVFVFDTEVQLLAALASGDVTALSTPAEVEALGLAVFVSLGA